MSIIPPDVLSHHGSHESISDGEDLSLGGVVHGCDKDPGQNPHHGSNDQGSGSKLVQLGIVILLGQKLIDHFRTICQDSEKLKF